MYPTIRLNSSYDMPLLGLGLYKATDPVETREAICAAAMLGYRLFDTASVYKNEELVGQGIAECGVPRKDLFITTKIWNNAQRVGNIESSFERSLERLGLDYIDLYQTKDVWKEFVNIIGVATDLQFEDQIVQVSYQKADSSLYYMEAQQWSIPVAPRIEGYTFLKWEVLAGDLADGIVLQAVYEKKQATGNSQEPKANSQAPKAQKLIQRGNVYILRDDEMFTIMGQKVK